MHLGLGLSISRSGGRALTGAGTPAGDLLGLESRGLAFDFTENSAVRRGYGALDYSGTITDLGYFNRDTVGGYVLNSSGLLVPTAADEMLIDHLSDGTALGAGLFQAYTNFFTFSEQFNAWTPTRATVTVNAAVAPDGATTADKFVEDSTAASSHFVNQGYTFTSGATYTMSVFAKAAERTEVQIHLGAAGFPNTPIGIFDLTSGEASGTDCTVHIQSYPNGWYRCSVTATADASVGAGTLVVLGVAGAAVYDGDGTSGLYIWGAQLTATAFPMPYLKTSGALTVSRDADAFVMSGTDFSDVWNATEGTFYIEFATPNSVLDAVAMGVTSTGTFGNSLYLNKTATTNAIALISSNGNLSLNLGNNVPAGNKGAFSYDGAQVRASLNGASAVVDSSVSGLAAIMSAATKLQVGAPPWSSGGASWLNGHIKRVSYVPRALPAATIEARTA